jgi:hypothetical protein
MITLIRSRLGAAAVVAISTLAAGGCSGAITDALKHLTSTYTVGGTVTGLSGSGLVLEDNGSDDLTVAANGTYTFATPLMSGANYAVTVKTQPTTPAQTCTVSNASGNVASANITNVAVSCTNNAAPATTAVGTPLPAAPSSQVIDSTGGSITSGDGRLTVTVPAGAVAGATTFTIQPITNQAPGGVGNAYRLGPDGQTFSTPVSISLHYSSADLAGTGTDVLSLAYQDAQGRWAVYKSVTLDTTGQTLMVSSGHFSDWALFAQVSLEPPAARIATGQTQTLSLLSCGLYDAGDPQIALAVACEPLDNSNVWSANGVPDGNSSVGTIVTPGSADLSSAIYTAPGTIPAANPVAVSVGFLLNPLAKNAPVETFVSNITIGGCSASSAQDCTWTGTSSAQNDHWKATASITWKWQKNDPGDPNIAYYVPESGAATLIDLQPNCSVDGAAQPIGDDANSVPPSQLTINYNTNPPTVGGTGTNLKGWTESCNPPENPPPTPGAVWWVDAGSPMSADGVTIEGTATFGGVTSTWSFKAN